MECGAERKRKSSVERIQWRRRSSVEWSKEKRVGWNSDGLLYTLTAIRSTLILGMRSTTWGQARMAGKFCFNRHLFSIALLCFIAWAIPTVCQGLQILDYDEITQKAIRHAHDISMSALDVKISQAEYRRALALYWPTISTRWNTEYVKDLTDGTSKFTSVGNTVLVQNTMYQSSFMFIGSYNLFDFGATSKKVLIANKDVDKRKVLYMQSVRDVKVKVLNAYTDLLTSYEEFIAKKELLTLHKELALTKKRLYEAGRISKIEMTDDALRAVKMIDDVDTLKLKFTTLLEDLSFFTGESYDSERLEMSGFKGDEGALTNTFKPENTPESKAYDLEIEKKKAEVQVLRRSLFPQFAAYSNYIWYASNPHEADTSAQYIKPRNFIVGVSITLPLFEGFKSNAEIAKAKVELDRLKVEKSRKLAELSNRYAKLSETRKTYIGSIANHKDMLMKVEENLGMAQRLTSQQVMEWVDFLTRKIDLVNQKFELTKTMIAKISTIKEIQILSEMGE